MTAALTLLLKLLPLYITVALGWIAGRYLQASSRHIAGIMLYIVTPSVVFSGVMAAPLSAEVILLPLLTFALCSLIGVAHLWVARRVLTDGSASIIPCLWAPAIPATSVFPWHYCCSASRVWPSISCACWAPPCSRTPLASTWRPGAGTASGMRWCECRGYRRSMPLCWRYC